MRETAIVILGGQGVILLALAVFVVAGIRDGRHQKRLEKKNLDDFKRHGG